MEKTEGYPKYKCLDCGDIIQSSYPGDWVCCKCFEDGVSGGYVDSNNYITRIGGNVVEYVEDTSKDGI